MSKTNAARSLGQSISTATARKRAPAAAKPGRATRKQPLPLSRPASGVVDQPVLLRDGISQLGAIHKHGLLAGGALRWALASIRPEEAERLLRFGQPGDEAVGRRTDVIQMGLEAAFEKGHFLLNGDAIVLDPHGIVLDGFRRLHACLRTGQPFTTLVVQGIGHEDALRTLNVVHKRRLRDILSIAKHEDSGLLQFTLNVLSRLPVGGSYKHAIKEPRLLKKMLEDNPSIADKVRYAKGRENFAANISVRAAVHFLLSRIDSAAADSFFEGFYDVRREENLAEGDARRKLAKLLLAYQEATQTCSQKKAVALFILAWNAWRQDKLVTKLDWRDTAKGKSIPADIFPTPHGWRDEHNFMPVMAEDDHSDNSSPFEVNVELAEVTPEEAAHILAEQNDFNREPSQRAINKVAEDIKAGKWVLNGNSIKFDNGTRQENRQPVLMDGQHRLRACVAANRPIVTLVVTGLNPQVFHTYDLGYLRTAAHVLREKGFEYTQTVAAAAKILDHVEAGRAHTFVDLSINSILEVLARYPEFLKSQKGTPTYALRWNKDCAGVKGFMPAYVAAATVLFSRVDLEKADAFMELMASTRPPFTRLPKGHPVRTALDVLSNRHTQDGTGRMGQMQRVSLLVHAFNAFCEGKPLKGWEKTREAGTIPFPGFQREAEVLAGRKSASR